MRRHRLGGSAPASPPCPLAPGPGPRLQPRRVTAGPAGSVAVTRAGPRRRPARPGNGWRPRSARRSRPRPGCPPRRRHRGRCGTGWPPRPDVPLTRWLPRRRRPDRRLGGPCRRWRHRSPAPPTSSPWTQPGPAVRIGLIASARPNRVPPGWCCRSPGRARPGRPVPRAPRGRAGPIRGPGARARPAIRRPRLPRPGPAHRRLAPPRSVPRPRPVRPRPARPELPRGVPPSRLPARAAPGGATAPAGSPASAGAAANRAAAPEPDAVGPDTESSAAFSARVHEMAAHARRHQIGRVGARTAQDASAPDQLRDVRSQAGQIQLDEMSRQEPPPFDAAAFKVGIHAAIATMVPPGSLDVATHFAESQQAGQVAGQLHDLAAQHETHSQQGLRSATEAEPRTDGLTPKPVAKMVNDPATVALPSPAAAAAIPGPRPPELVDLSAGPAEIDARMAARGLTEDQLATSGEPSFTRVLDGREEVRTHATEAPAQYRAQEQLTLGQARGDAQLHEDLAHQGLRSVRGSRIHRATFMKETARTADQKQRDDVAGEILGIHERTRTEVGKLLNGLAHDAETVFMGWEMVARGRFELHVAHQMNVYKADRVQRSPRVLPGPRRRHQRPAGRGQPLLRGGAGHLPGRGRRRGRPRGRRDRGPPERGAPAGGAGPRRGRAGQGGPARVAWPAGRADGGATGQPLRPPGV